MRSTYPAFGVYVFRARRHLGRAPFGSGCLCLAPARAVRPSAASEPTEVSFTKYQEVHGRSPHRMACVVGAGLSRRSVATHKARLSSGQLQNPKQNTVMARTLRHPICLIAAGASVHGHRLSSGSGNEALPNHSVEATNCSKLQFAPHLKR